MSWNYVFYQLYKHAPTAGLYQHKQCLSIFIIIIIMDFLGNRRKSVAKKKKKKDIALIGRGK